jgi:hypothetical protein
VTPRTRDQVAEKRRRNDHRPGAPHADRHGDKELRAIQPASLLDQFFLEIVVFDPAENARSPFAISAQSAFRQATAPRIL